MRTTMDKAGRLVVPKALRDQVGIRPGEVEIVVDGASLRLEPVTTDGLVDERGWLVIPPSGVRLTDDDVLELRRADQR